MNKNFSVTSAGEIYVSIILESLSFDVPPMRMAIRRHWGFVSVFSGALLRGAYRAASP
jgi:hypothetical protein